MPDFHGPIQHVTIAGTLWLILALPAAATIGIALYALLRARRGAGGRAPGPLDPRAREAIAVVSVGFLAVSFALIAYHAVLLVTRPAGEQFFLQHLWPMVRVGQLDASFDVAFDLLSATMSLLIAGLGLPIFVVAATRRKDDPSYARFFAWLNGLVAALLLLVLADNFVLLFFGWEGVGLCSWGLAGFWWRSGGPTAGRTGFLVNRVADVGLVLGIALLYWGLGGGWENGDYVPDLNARFSSVEVGAGASSSTPTVSPSAAPPPSERDEEDERSGSSSLPSTAGEGFLTLTSYSGAVVFMDDARVPLERAPGELLRAPFSRFPVKGGLHSFRIQLGSAVEDSLVTHVAFGGQREIALTSFGPTVTFRNLRDQLAARDGHGNAPVREALMTKRAVGSFTVLALACVCFFAGAIGKSIQLPGYALLSERGLGPMPAAVRIHAVTTVIPGVYLAVRLAFLFALQPLATTAIAFAGAVAALSGATIVLAIALEASTFFDGFDRYVIGGFVNAAAAATRVAAFIAGRADEALVDGAVRAVGEGALRVGGRLQRAQTGRVQTYVLVIVAGVMALAFIPYWLR